MKTMTRIAGLLGILVVCGLHAAGTLPAGQQIRAQWDGMQRAANAHDTDRFMAAFAHGPNLVFAVNGEVIHGWDALRAQQLKWWNHGKSDARYTQVGKLELMPLGRDAEVSTASFTSRRTRRQDQHRRIRGHLCLEKGAARMADHLWPRVMGEAVGLMSAVAGAGTR